jgi:hypothetical protein
VNKLKSFKNDKIKIIEFDNLNHYLTKGELTVKTRYEIDNSAKHEIIIWILNQ